MRPGLSDKSTTRGRRGPRHFRSAMRERQSTSRGPFAVTESDCKHARCRLRINAVADDRRFVALEASGSDDLYESQASRVMTDTRLLEIVRSGSQRQPEPGACVHGGAAARVLAGQRCRS
jgi:hypothetical protein